MIAALFPLLTSSKKYNIICTQNKMQISIRLYPGGIPGSSGAGKTPKIPPSSVSSSETKVPNTPYNVEDLEKGAKDPWTKPVEDPYVLPYIPSQIPSQLSSSNTIKSSKSLSAEMKKSSQEVTKTIKTAEDHKKLVESSQPKTSPSNTPTVTTLATPTTSTTTISDNPTPIIEDVELDIFKEKDSTPIESSTIQQGRDLVAITVKSDARTPSGQPLKSHEVGKSGHTLVGEKDDVSGTIKATHMLTSGKKNPITGIPNTTIDKDNNFKQTGKPQRMGELETPRLFLNDQEKKSFDFDKDATDFINNPIRKKKVENIIDNIPPKHMTTRPHKDDAELYTEDGVLHSDNEDIERSPLPQKTESDILMPIPETPNNFDSDKHIDDVD